MARFDVYRRRGGPGYLLDVQSHFLGALQTRVVVPLLPIGDMPAPLRDLHPVFRIDGRDWVMATQFLAAMPKRELGRVTGNLEAEREGIVRALDLLLTGF